MTFVTFVNYDKGRLKCIKGRECTAKQKLVSSLSITLDYKTREQIEMNLKHKMKDEIQFYRHQSVE